MSYIKSYIVSILLLAVFWGARAQTAPPPPAAKADFKLIFEKTYLHTDRDVYAQGDTLWFKAYLVNAQNNQPVNSSGNLYVELIAPDSAKIVGREIIRLENGLGNGDFDLADSLASGQYRLRAYTNWMRNFGDNFVFEKNITILNTEAAPAVPGQVTEAKNKKNLNPNMPASTIATASVKLPVVRFYPEGGSLVQGISSIVGVKAENINGAGIQLTGTVLSSAGDTVSRFNCDSLGMGLFALLPVEGQTYKAVVNQASFPLPAALSNGPVLQARQTDSVIHAIVSTNEADGTAYTIVVKHAGVTFLSQQLQMAGPQLSVKIPTATLPEGIAAITLYNSQGKPECERLVYIHQPGSSTHAVISTNKKTYQAKEQVTVNISSQPNSNLSMAVVDAGLVPEQADDIVSAFLLQSEVKGNIEQARRYFDTTNVNRFKQLDLLLLTQGWRDFVWRRLADTAIHISYAAENGIVVSGRVRDEVMNKMMPNLHLTLYAPGAKGTKLYTGLSDSLGRFNFGGLMLYGQQNVRLTSVNDKGEKKGSFMVDTLLPLAVKPRIRYNTGTALAADSAAKVAVEQRITAIKNAKINGVTKLKEVSIKAKHTLMTRSGNVLTSWGPDQAFDIKPDDEKYKTLEWFILQNVKGAQESSGIFHGIIPTGVEFSGIDTTLHAMPSFNGGISKYQGKSTLIPPQIFVNGQELYMDENTQAEAYRFTYFNLPITKIKRVVVKHMVGSIHGLSAAGTSLDPSAETVMVDRYLLYLTMDANALVDNPGLINLDMPGYYDARVFYKPLPHAKPSVADYRTTIHWEPNIKTDATGKATISYYNAVPQADVRVIVEGITAAGTPVANTTVYETK